MATTEERDIFNNEYVQIYTNGSGNIVLLFQNEVEKTAVILVSYYVVGIDCSEIRNVLRYTERSLMA